MSRPLRVRNRSYGFWIAGILATVAALALQHPAYAQALDPTPTPAVNAFDDMRVNLKGGDIVRSMGHLTLGRADHPSLDYGILPTSFFVSGHTPIYGTVTQPCGNISGVSCAYMETVWNLNGETELYSSSPPSTSAPTGFTEQGSMVSGGLSITRKDGTIWQFSSTAGIPPPSPAPDGLVGLVSSITYPDGEVLTYNYASNGDLRSIVSTTGYMMHFEGYKPYNGTPPTKVVLINLSTDYCDPMAVTCTGLTVNWPSVTFTASSGGGTNYRYATDNLGRMSTRAQTNSAVTINGNYQNWTATFRHTSPEGRWYEWQRFNALYSQPSSDGVMCTARSILQWVNSPVGQWNYSFTGGTTDCHFSHVTGGVSTGPDGITQKWDVNGGAGFVDGLNRKTLATAGGYLNFFGSGELDITSITKPEGNRFDYTRDARRNVTQTTETAKSGGATISASASYPSTCTATTAKTCNQPDYTIDANGNRTDFTYFSAHGGIDTQTLPAADTGGIRPKIRYAYQQISAHYKNSAGTLISGPAIWKLTSTSTCQTTATCTGTSDEVITSYTYNDNLLPATVTVQTGNGTILSSITTTYDPVGNVVAVDGPMPGAVDTTYSFYDDARQKIGEIGPDPDGGGSLPRPAVRITYDLDGNVTRTETGTATGTTLSSLNAMTVAQYVDTTYDDMGRAIRKTVVAGGATQSVTQYTYDVRNRVICTALRMNPAVYGSLPSNACGAGTTGSYGPDRITVNVYDAAGQLTQVVQAYGTANQRTYSTAAYSDNGLPVDSIDANGNRTHLTYDGFDRLSTTYFPSTTRPTAFNPETQSTALATAGAYDTSINGYEAFGYDNVGNRTSWQRRGGNVIQYTFDHLNRQTVKDLPGGTSADVYTGYDLLNRVVYKRFVSATGTGVSYTYDGLGRVTSTTDMNGRTVGYQYNAASARTRLTYPDSNYLGYSLDDANRLTGFGWNANSGVFSQSYDALSRVNSMAKGSGSTGYTYDSVGRLASITNDLAGTTNDITWTFSARNPAGQIATQTASSEVYDYRAASVSTTDKTYDGLNRDAGIAALSGGYDVRGNMAFDGTRTFTYDLENRLLTASGGSANLTLTYDPEGRLASYTSGSTLTTFLYDGVDLIAEYNGAGQILRRYVHSTAADDPVIWYEGSGTSDARYLYTNHQGSIIGYANAAGTLLDLYKYGYYGEPKGANNSDSWTGARFRYTGQTMLPEAKLYYYKARVYDPAAGRFLQIDPIGSADDLNLYAYVGDDPTNRNDPSGTAGPSGPCVIWIAGCPIYGTAQTTGTPGHAAAGLEDAKRMAASGKYDSVHLDQRLDKITGDPRVGRQRPDVAGVLKTGKGVDTIEHPSQSQTPQQMTIKNAGIQQRLAAIGRAGTPETRTIGQALAEAGQALSGKAGKVLGVAGYVLGLPGAFEAWKQNPDMTIGEFGLRAAGQYDIAVEAGLIKPDLII